MIPPIAANSPPTMAILCFGVLPLLIENVVADADCIISGSSAYPSCLKHIYADTVFFGYTLFGCGKTSGSDVVYYSSTDSSGRSTTPRVSPNTSPTAPPASTTTTPPPTAPAASSSSPPAGAIAGGVVGGVAVIALVGFGIFFLLRRNKKQPPPSTVAPSTTQSPPPGGPPGVYGAQPPPEMGQQYPPQGFVPVDNRASIAKPPYGVTHSVYDPNMSVSPPGSPPAQSHSPSLSYQPYGAAHSPGTYQPTSPTATQYSNTGSQPANGMGYQSGPVPSYQQQTAAELPAQRGDGELRELA